MADLILIADNIRITMEQIPQVGEDMRELITRVNDTAFRKQIDELAG